MRKLYTFTGIILGTILLFSFSTNPPDGNTGAPGDNLCVQCHTQTNPSQNGTITVEGFPSNITPNETYTLTAVNRVTAGTAVRGGFQVTILGPLNTKAGELTNPSSTSAVSINAGRQYWDHDPALEYPDSNVVKWTVQWTAPEMPSGSVITWYAAGNIANGNFQNTGDRIVTASGSGLIILSATEDIMTEKTLVYPNPGTDQIQILFGNGDRLDGQVLFYDLFGKKMGQAAMESGVLSTILIPSGIYLLEINAGDQTRFIRWSKI